jgi:hypothetical protein
MAYEYHIGICSADELQQHLNNLTSTGYAVRQIYQEFGPQTYRYVVFARCTVKRTTTVARMKGTDNNQHLQGSSRSTRSDQGTPMSATADRQRDPQRREPEITQP